MRVCVRIRPDDSQIDTKRHSTQQRPAAGVTHSGLECEAKVGRSVAVNRGAKQERFSFDAVLGPQSTQFDVYAHCGEPLLDAVMEGGLNIP